MLSVLARHTPWAVLAVLIWGGSLWAIDRISGPPQTIPDARNADPVIAAGEAFKVEYTSIKTDDCPAWFKRELVQMVSREDLTPVNPPVAYPVRLVTPVGTHGRAEMGRSTAWVRVQTPADIAPGLYRYWPNIERQCTKIVGRRWVIYQPPVYVEIRP